MQADCIKIKDTRKVFAAKEEGKVYTLYNNSKLKIAKIQIDGCIFKEYTEKCDWLFLIEEHNAIFVELKGSDIEKGISQLLSTYDKLKTEKDIKGCTIWFRLSIGEKNSVPRIVKTNSTYKKLFEISEDNIKIGKQLSDTV
jgi:hypothetical protein